MNRPLRLPGGDQPPPASAAPPPSGRWRRGMIAVSGVLLLLVWARRPASAPPPCTVGTSYLVVITAHEQATRWAAAASTAELAVRDPQLCAADRPALAQKAVAAGLEDLFSMTFAPGDVAAQQQAVARYRSLRRQAIAAGTPFPSPRQIASRAYQIGQFLLAKTALEDAFAEGSFVLTDQALLQQYVSTLYNLGRWWTEAGPPDSATEGMRLLVASTQLDRRYCVGAGDAWGALRALLGPDERRWPAPATTPILDSPPTGDYLCHQGASPTAAPAGWRTR